MSHLLLATHWEGLSMVDSDWLDLGQESATWTELKVSFPTHITLQLEEEVVSGERDRK